MEVGSKEKLKFVFQVGWFARKAADISRTTTTIGSTYPRTSGRDLCAICARGGFGISVIFATTIYSNMEKNLFCSQDFFILDGIGTLKVCVVTT